MKITIHNLKVAQHLSEETTAYTATIHVDGHKAFAASNNGHGGADNFQPLPGYTGPSLAEVDGWLALNEPPTRLFADDLSGTPCDLEMLMIREIETRDIDKQIQRRLKNVVAIDPGGRLVSFNSPATPANIERLRADKPDYTIVNGGDADLMKRARVAFCGGEDGEDGSSDPLAACYRRARENEMTLADARFLLAEEERGERPCPDHMAHLREFIASADAREQANKAAGDERRAAEDAQRAADRASVEARFTFTSVENSPTMKVRDTVTGKELEVGLCDLGGVRKALAAFVCEAA